MHSEYLQLFSIHIVCFVLKGTAGTFKVETAVPEFVIEEYVWATYNPMYGVIFSKFFKNKMVSICIMNISIGVQNAIM